MRCSHNCAPRELTWLRRRRPWRVSVDSAGSPIPRATGSSCGSPPDSLSPQLGGLVAAAGGQGGGVGAERHRVDGVLVPRESGDELARLAVPQLHFLVDAAGGQGGAVGTER